MIISVTERHIFQRCRQQWAWSSFNKDAYQPIISKPAFAIGRLWHATQAEWSLRPNANPNELVLDLANDELDRTRAAYLERTGAPISDLELEPVYEQMGMVIAMVNNYYKRWGTPLPQGFTMVAPEQTCVIPIPNTQHECEICKGTGVVAPYSLQTTSTEFDSTFCNSCDGSGESQHFLEGTLDGLIRDDYGRVYVLERKTYGQRPKIEVLNMQDQFLAYLWILRSLDIGDVGGLAYDGAWKRQQPPKNSSLEDLFLRVRLSRNSHELDRFANQLTMQANEMANNPEIYPNRRWDGCWDCSLVAPCVAQERGEDFQYILNTLYMQRPASEHSTRDLVAAKVDE